MLLHSQIHKKKKEEGDCFLERRHNSMLEVKMKEKEIEPRGRAS